MTTHVLVLGTGAFAQRIAADLAATATEATHMVIAGRNALRLAWIATAARARADMFARPVRVSTAPIDLAIDGAAAELIARLKPRVIVQAASFQTASVIAGGGNAWTSLVAAGGLSATAVFQALLTSRIARAVAAVHPDCHLINCCFPDVANGIVAAMGLPVTCGIGNIAILSHAFAGVLADEGTGRDGGAAGGSRPHLQVLAHYQCIGAWRRPAAGRRGSAARVWIDGVEVADIYGRFADVQLTPEPVIDISGASGVTLIRAMAHGQAWRGHAPGPAGLPGGYPVAFDGRLIALDLPASLDRAAAIAWNEAHEAANGLLVDADGRARYTGQLYDRLAVVTPALAAGFNVRDLEAVHTEMHALRTRLTAQSA